jgi:hypothetical protein
MVFTTPWFLVFSISTSVAYLFFSRYRINRLIVLALASIIFYINLTGVGAFFFIVILAIFTFFSGLCIANYRGLYKKILLIFCLIPAVASLLYFNYFLEVSKLNFADIYTKVSILKARL